MNTTIDPYKRLDAAHCDIVEGQNSIIVAIGQFQQVAANETLDPGLRGEADKLATSLGELADKAGAMVRGFEDRYFQKIDR